MKLLNNESIIGAMAGGKDGTQALLYAQALYTLEQVEAMLRSSTDIEGARQAIHEEHGDLIAQWDDYFVR